MSVVATYIVYVATVWLYYVYGFDSQFIFNYFVQTLHCLSFAVIIAES